jgi:transcription elongation factor GreB
VSRAFVKDDDDRPEKPPPRAVDSDRPNYVTPEGMAKLREALEKARSGGDERNAEYYEARIAGAVLVEAGSSSKREVEFGSTVTLREEDGRSLSLRIVGEDEADPAHGTISWTSPYARALMGQRPGARVVVARPAGATTVTIESIS